jgi:signal transduction histidine kinase
MKALVRNLIIGESHYIQSWNEFRKVILSGQYALISMCVLIFFLSMELPDAPAETLAVFGTGILMLLISLVLHRMQLHDLSNYLLFATLNVLLFLVASSESLFNGSIIFFVPMVLASFAVFHYSQRAIAVAFAIFSFVLALLAFTQKISFLPYHAYSQAGLQINLCINFLVALAVSIITIYLLISVSHYNSKKLISTNEQLHKLNEELDRFVYSTSHDLRAPLLSIKGLLELSETANGEEKGKYLELMKRSIYNLEKFITDLTDYSRNSRQKIMHEKVNVYLLAQDIWDSLRFNEAAAGIDFINELPKDFVLPSDESRMKVVLSNLISNAVFYHDRSKAHQYVRLYHQTTDEYLSLIIEDNGQGIAPELQTRVFDMFFRGNQSSQGSGLGLYIVQETLSKLSATIRLDSEPQKGSTFSILFPVKV